MGDDENNGLEFIFLIGVFSVFTVAFFWIVH